MKEGSRIANTYTRNRTLLTYRMQYCGESGILHLRHHQPRKPLHHLKALRKRRMKRDLLQPLALKMPQLLHQISRLADDAEVANDFRREELRFFGFDGGVVAGVHGEV